MNEHKRYHRAERVRVRGNRKGLRQARDRALYQRAWGDFRHPTPEVTERLAAMVRDVTPDVTVNPDGTLTAHTEFGRVLAGEPGPAVTFSRDVERGMHRDYPGAVHLECSACGDDLGPVGDTDGRHLAEAHRPVCRAQAPRPGDHGDFLIGADVGPQSLHTCRDCAEGKCGACNGEALIDGRDGVTVGPCGCAFLGHGA